ncbi:MAG TPA: nuclear transport factor 2 family protein [Amycolatopsis sp.]|uniref:nuclear transport factor 2 family protein n=1 Tax=Amycolatopsis sp. TaxID=37632 RepID=UPI002B488E68|nr:nuclear transport factor 2 family protein [Amycolatopsis sp.]HKS50150.1 nuclear transport factor 2 family protein [Amycolatopsis sp.]
MTETQTTRGTSETIDEFFARFGAGDRAGMLALFAEDADLMVAGAGIVPWTGRRRGHAEIGEFLDSVLNDVKTERFDIDRILVERDGCVVLGSFAHRILRTGKIFAGPFALHVAVRDGLIRTYHMFEDSYAASVAFTE